VWRFSAIVAVARESDLFCAFGRYAPAVPCHATSVARFLDANNLDPMSLVAAPVAGSSSRARLARSQADSRATVATVACVSLCALVLVAPFEALRPLITLPGQSLSSVEAALLAALGFWGIALVSMRTVPVWRTPLTLPWLALIAAMLAAALAAPAYRSNALNMVGRLGLAFAVYLLTVNAATSAVRLRTVLVAAAAAGVAVALLGALEYFAVDPVLRALSTFREWVALVGAQVRASGPLQYPTIASMFLEIAYALTLGLMLMALEAGRRRIAVICAVAAAIIGLGIIFTFTRAGLLTVASTLGVMAFLRFRRHRFDLGVVALVLVAAVFAVQLLSSRSLEYLRLRLTTETMEAWFRAEIEAPATLELTTGARSSVPVRLRNAGGATWDSSAAQPFQFSYHWLLADQDAVVAWEGLRTPFPVRVPPGASIALNAEVEAPRQPGEYRLMWDVEQRHRLWFSTEPEAALSTTRVVVSGPATGPLPRPYLTALPANPARPGRLVLWSAAASLLSERPLFGVGPDNYRLQYGQPAGLENFDRRVHANNMYVEMLVGGGIVGGAAFGWLCWAAAAQVAAAVRAARGTALEPAVAAIAAATLAIALHGLVDSFLSFTATYILFAVTLGLTSASVGPHGTHAHRI
jgi:hypothetical protein